MTAAAYQPEDRVRLVTPDNPRLHGQAAEVERVEDRAGVAVFHVLTPAAGLGKFRALAAELEPFAPPAAPRAGTRVPSHDPYRGRGGQSAAAKEQGFDESPCPQCGAFKLRRAGSCLCCQECGATTGCG